MDVDVDLLMKVARGIAEEAGSVLLDGAAGAGVDVSMKRSVMDVVTETDRAAERLIVERIRASFPDDAILGEEGASFTGTTGRRWIIDPLDGTANFTRGWTVSAVSIGIEIDGAFTVGVVFNPFHAEMFAAATGRGAYLNDARLEMSADSPGWVGAFVGVDGGYEPQTRFERSEVARSVVLDGGDVRIVGSTALALCYLAAGRFDAHSNTRSSIWDIAAGTVIAREAGYTVEGLLPGSEPTAERCLSGRPELMAMLRTVVEQASQLAAAR